MRAEYKVLCVCLMILEWQVYNSFRAHMHIEEKPLQARGEAGVFVAPHRWLGAFLMGE